VYNKPDSLGCNEQSMAIPHSWPVCIPVAIILSRSGSFPFYVLCIKCLTGRHNRELMTIHFIYKTNQRINNIFVLRISWKLPWKFHFGIGEPYFIWTWTWALLFFFLALSKLIYHTKHKIWILLRQPSSTNSDQQSHNHFLVWNIKSHSLV
jgi:hypothetical protein